MIDYWRVGVPSIGETWPRRFSHGRSTGGIGTGIYAFRDREAAERNVANKPPEAKSEIFEIRNAVENPIQPTTIESTELLNRLGRRMALVAHGVAAGQADWDRVFERGEFLGVDITGGIGGDPRIDDGGKAFSSDFISLLGGIPELNEKYRYDTSELAMDALRATKEALEAVDGDARFSEGPQPLNYLLWPEFDGVAPKDGAGGNIGKFGCNILIERVQECVTDRELEYNSRIEADVLNRCFSR